MRKKNSSYILEQTILSFSTSSSLVPFNFILEETREDKFISDGTSTTYSLTNINNR